MTNSPNNESGEGGQIDSGDALAPAANAELANTELKLSATSGVQHIGQRFDQVAALLFPQYSRSMLQSWIKKGELQLSGKTVKPNVKLSGGETLTLATVLQAEGEWEAENIPLDIVYEDAAVIVINKSAGLVVHPGAGNWNGTLLNALLFLFPELRQVPRAGIVHRLDKDTSGLMVVARTIEAQNSLVQQLQARSVKRFYQAIVRGECGLGSVEDAIGRHPTQRTKMAVLKEGSAGAKEARTHYQNLEQFEGFTYVELKLDTGRTHQIRVHMAHIGHPLVGDPAYGKRINEQEIKKTPELKSISDFQRQALHARRLGFIHPQSGEYCEWQSELPEDFQSLLELLRHAF
ncbi:MAG: 23S rRNA pseudouridine(1911/1915/1917) synthase RluD [Agarilytica sp.]